MEKTFLCFDNYNSLELPDHFKNDDVRFSFDFAEYFIERYSSVRDMVFDPFAGFGTTLIAAERTNRCGFGMEFDKERVAYIKTQIQNKKNILCGDSLKLSSYHFPLIDFSLTSPPYMTINDHDEYPFAGYKVTGKGYSQYLKDIQQVYRQMKDFMKPDAYVAIEISNIRKNGVFTPLAWDVATTLSEILHFEKEIILCWNNQDEVQDHTYGFEYDHSYCFVFKN